MSCCAETWQKKILKYKILSCILAWLISVSYLNFKFTQIKALWFLSHTSVFTPVETDRLSVHDHTTGLDHSYSEMAHFQNLTKCNVQSCASNKLIDWSNSCREAGLKTEE